MKKLLKHLKEYKIQCLLAPLFKLLEASFELFVPLVVASIIDNGIANDDKMYILQRFGLLVLLAMVGLTSAIFAQYYSAKAAVGFAGKVRYMLFSHIQTLSFTDLDKLGTSTMVTRLTSDVNQVQTGVNLTLRLLLRSPFIVFGAMIMAFTVDVKVAWIFVIVIPVLFVIVFAIMANTLPRYNKIQKNLDIVVTKTRENLSGTRVLRAFTRQEREIYEYTEAVNELEKIQEITGKISNIMNPATFIVINVATAFVIYVGAIRVDVGDLTQGQVVALVNYMSQILVELVKLANLIITITKAIASGNRVQAVLEIENFDILNMSKEDNALNSEIESEFSNNDYVVSFENACLTYAGDLEPSLENLNFSVKKGENIGIIGGTGSGKTSVVNLIAGYYKATEGSVKVCGKDVKKYEKNELLNKVSVVLQKAVLFKGTIRDNITFGMDNVSDEDIMEACRIAQATDVVNSKEGKLDALVEEGGKNFSGGQKQRLSIARALLRKPEILILDDSSSALDNLTDAALRREIDNLSYKPTLFIISQRTSSLEKCDRILVLEDGKPVGLGSHKELLSKESDKFCEVYEEIYNSGFVSATKNA